MHKQSFFLCFLLILCGAQVVIGLCSNGCSGHGWCDNQNVCHCNDDFRGHDCSLRKCPVSKSWGTIRGIESAHHFEECSGRGTCAEETGTCKCQQGFSGHACQLLDCPDDCFSRGKCITMRELAQNQVMSREIYDKFEFVYDNIWDHDMIRGCKCDVGYFGTSCGSKTCPLGDDPLTTNQKDEIQLIQCTTKYLQQQITLRYDGILTKGTFILMFGKQYTRPIHFNALATLDSSTLSMKSSLLTSLSGITDVTVTRTDSTNTIESTMTNQIDWNFIFPEANSAHSSLVPKWKRLEVQSFFCAATSGTFSIVFNDILVSNIPFNVDTRTFKEKLKEKMVFLENLDIFLSNGDIFCSPLGTFVTIQFTKIWHRALIGDLPTMQLSNMNSNGIVTLFLNDADGFIDTETIEVVKGIDTCRMIEIQQIFCAATSGKFRLFFNDDDGFVLNDLPFDISAKELETKMETLIPYIVDVDVSFSSTTSSSTTTTTTTTATPTSACSLTGTMITISFVVVKTTGAKNDGDLAEISVDRTNGGGDGLTHLSNRLQLANAFTEVQKGTTCIEFDQGLMIDPLKQMTSTTTMMTSDGNSASRGGSFAVSFRGFTSPPIPANALPEEVGNILQSMPSIQGVNVSFTGAVACETPPNVMSITFTQNFGNLPTMTVDSSLISPGSQIQVASSGAKFQGITSEDGTKETDVCSNRGICDESKLGKCNCFLGYTNSDGRGGIGNNQINRGDCGSTSRIPVGCPGDFPCSGHGTCSGAPSYRCNCQEGWRAGDCSERVCPSGLSWFDYPTENNVAHRRMDECSGVGTCDRSNGACKCPRPFTGYACELMSCGGIATECSGNGRCLNLRDLAPLIKVKGELAGFSYGEDPNDSNTWERQKIRACLCDPGFFGYDCSLRECPRGDDPNTLNDAIEVQLIQCIANGGIFQLSFRDEITGDIAFNANDASIKAALEALETIGTVQVTLFNGMTACSTTGNTLIAVEFSTELGDLPSLKGYTDYLKDNVNGNGADGTGKLQMATGGAMLGGKTSIKGTRENIFCSNHGKCDYSTGQCICDPQFGSSNGKGGLGPIGDCGYQFVKGVQAAED